MNEKGEASLMHNRKKNSLTSHVEKESEDLLNWSVACSAELREHERRWYEIWALVYSGNYFCVKNVISPNWSI